MVAVHPPSLPKPHDVLTHEGLGFLDGEHLVTWTTPDDLVQKLRYWLRPQNEERRRELAAAGQLFCLENHSFDVRVQELLSMLDELGWNASRTKLAVGR